MVPRLRGFRSPPRPRRRPAEARRGDGDADGKQRHRRRDRMLRQHGAYARKRRAALRLPRHTRAQPADSDGRQDGEPRPERGGSRRRRGLPRHRLRAYRTAGGAKPQRHRRRHGQRRLRAYQRAELADHRPRRRNQLHPLRQGRRQDEPVSDVPDDGRILHRLRHVQPSAPDDGDDGRSDGTPRLRHSPRPVAMHGVQQHVRNPQGQRPQGHPRPGV